MDAARRRFVNERAGQRCEYCHLHRNHQAVAALQIKHSLQHGLAMNERAVFLQHSLVDDLERGIVQST